MTGTAKDDGRKGGDDCCPFHLADSVDCRTVGPPERGRTDVARCRSEEYERCPAYLVKLLSSQRPAFWNVGRASLLAK